MSGTPIFDLEREAPKPRASWVPKLIGFIFGVGIGLIVILADQGQLSHWHGPGFNGLLLIPALYAVIAVHEFGHAVAGSLAGLDFGGIAVGGFVLQKSGMNWTFVFNRRALVGGSFKPLTSRSTSASRYGWMIAGGPLASIALAASCGLLWTRSGNGTWEWTGSLLWVGSVIAIISLVPLSAGLNKSDGARLWQLLRRPERARSFMAILAIQTEEANGVRPREWDPEVFEQALTSDPVACEYPYCQLMAYYRRADEGLEKAALRHLENALARSASSGRPFRHVLFLEAASASAVIRKQAAQSRTWCERGCKLRKPEPLHAVQAGIAMCEGRYGEAVKHWEAARARLVQKRLDSGLARFAKEKWAEYESDCRSASNKTIPQSFV
ncbi:MAG: M50 family metallopeptidase [Bryobacteraceae bacterium]